MQKRKLFRFKKLGRATAKNLKSDFYIFGLGNPGEKYAHTRHNAGYDTLDIFAQKNNASFSTFAYKGLCAKIKLNGKTVLLIKPQTYMNHSGQCVIAFQKKLNIQNNQMIIVYDDIDLKKGMLRIRSGGSAGTHNGLRSIIYHLKKDNFTRVRIGIGRPRSNEDLIPFVIGRFPKKDWDLIFKTYTDAADALVEIIVNGVASAQSKYNKKGNAS